MKRNIILLLSLTVFLSTPIGAFAKVFYVQPPSVKVMSKPTFDAEVLGTVPSGYRFTAVGQSGKWLQFDYQGRTGFIFSSQALPNPPVAKPASVEGTGTQKLSARERASSAVAVAGVKGLTYEDRSRASGRERANYEELEKMEAIKVTPEEVKAFQQGGKP